jgi:hypothetical protein
MAEPLNRPLPREGDLVYYRSEPHKFLGSDGVRWKLRPVEDDRDVHARPEDVTPTNFDFDIWKGSQGL